MRESCRPRSILPSSLELARDPAVIARPRPFHSMAEQGEEKATETEDDSSFKSSASTVQGEATIESDVLLLMAREKQKHSVTTGTAPAPAKNRDLYPSFVRKDRSDGASPFMGPDAALFPNAKEAWFLGSNTSSKSSSRQPSVHSSPSFARTKALPDEWDSDSSMDSEKQTGRKLAAQPPPRAGRAARRKVLMANPVPISQTQPAAPLRALLFDPSGRPS